MHTHTHSTYLRIKKNNLEKSAKKTARQVGKGKGEGGGSGAGGNVIHRLNVE